MTGTITTPARNRIEIHTDGAAKGNPGPAGWAWWVNPQLWQAGGWRHATNNLAELTAVAEALDTFRGHDATLIIVTDSTYVKDACTVWIHNWRRNGWKTRTGAPVANADTISRIDKALRGHGDVHWQWVRGHTGHRGNEHADRLASAAAERARHGDTTVTGCPLA